MHPINLSQLTCLPSNYQVLNADWQMKQYSFFLLFRQCGKSKSCFYVPLWQGCIPRQTKNNKQNTINKKQKQKTVQKKVIKWQTKEKEIEQQNKILSKGR